MEAHAKIKETFDKDLKQKNNTITEMKNTVEGISRITEAEKWINEQEDRMVEITAVGQNKRIKRN